jgi:thiol-disulfide isomerase/thioredoxin
MMTRILPALVLLLFGFSPAMATTPYDAKAFMADQEAGKSVLIHVTAPWCPTCAKQKPTVSAIEKEKPQLVVYEVDFDSKKDVLKQFGVQMQSTLIVFKGKQEAGRSTGETDPAKIRSLVEKGAGMDDMMKKEGMGKADSMPKKDDMMKKGM